MYQETVTVVDVAVVVARMEGAVTVAASVVTVVAEMVVVAVAAVEVVIVVVGETVAVAVIVAAVNFMKNGVFWVVTPCGFCKNRRFGGTWRLLHQGDKNR
jgi:hypothetical protein